MLPTLLRSPTHFNSTKVQFGEEREVDLKEAAVISIPLRYNLEFALSAMTSHLSDFNSTKVQFGDLMTKKLDALEMYFNSTKVQFGDRTN